MTLVNYCSRWEGLNGVVAFNNIIHGQGWTKYHDLSDVVSRKDEGQRMKRITLLIYNTLTNHDILR